MTFRSYKEYRDVRLLKRLLLGIAVSAIPLFIYLNRFLIPDYGFDSLYYHLFNGHRSLNNLFLPFNSHEFYPNGFGTLAPSFDSLFALARKILGYRLGTIPGLLSYFGIVYVTYRLLLEIKSYYEVKSNLLKFMFLTNAIVVTELLFQLATYYVDILNTLVVLTAILGLIKYIKSQSIVLLCLVSLVFGLLLMAKVTNLMYVVPYFVVMFVELLSSSQRNKKQAFGLIAMIGILLITPTLVYDFKNLILTGNPVFPLFNHLFGSPYYAEISYSPQLTSSGGGTIFEKLIWPVASFWHPARLAEPHSLFNDWKLGVYWIMAISLILPKLWKNLTKLEKYTVVYFLLSVEVWALLIGIMRYAAAATVIGGVVLVILCGQLIANWHKFPNWSKVLLITVIVIFGVDNARIVLFNSKYDMSWRPSMLSNKTEYFAQFKNIGYRQLDGVKLSHDKSDPDIIVNCVPQSAGLTTISAYADKSVLNIMGGSQNEEMISQSAYRKAASERLSAAYHGKKVFTYGAFAIKSGLDVGLPQCMSQLKKAGASVDSVHPLNGYLGFPNQNPVLIRGTIRLDDYIRFDN